VLVCCGQHTYVNLEKVDVQRLPDGRARVTATVDCEQVSSRRCTGGLADYCIVVEWTGAAASTDRACVKSTLAVRDARQIVDVVSSAAPPASGARATVTLVTPTGGQVGGRGSPTTVDVP
jgi:hypothetical protein